MLNACLDDQVGHDPPEQVGIAEMPISISGNYQPSSAALAASSSYISQYNDAPPWNNGANCVKGALPGTLRLSQYLIQKFPGVSSIGGQSCRPNTANTAQTSIHGIGRALDIMIPMSGGAADNTVGDEIANWLISHAQELGIQYLIWDRTDFSPWKTSNRVGAYPGPNPHIDHIHVELTIAAAQNQNLPVPDPAFASAFDFSPSSSTVFSCSDVPTHDANWVYNCQHRQTVFQNGGDFFGVVSIDNVRKNLKFRVEAWRVDQLQYDWAWDEPDWRQVEPGFWSHTNFNPEFRNLWPGDWEMRVFVDVGSGFIQLTSLSFIVQGGNQQYPGYPYQYNGNAYHCKDGVTGGQDTNYIYTCNNPEQVYQQGDTVWSLFRIDHVATSHRFRARTYRNGQLISSWVQDGWNEVPSGQMWNYAYAWNNVWNALAGAYETHYDVEKKYDVAHPIDYDVAIVSFTVNTGPPYTYDGNYSRCANNPTGGQSTNWVYTCPGATTSFKTSEAIRVLLYVKNIGVSHKWRGKFFLNGSPTPYSIDETGWSIIPTGQIWSPVYTWPTLWYPPSGNWKASVEIDIGNGWQMLKDNITFTVASNPSGSYPYNGGMELCRGYYENERDGTGVPQCWNKVWGNQVDHGSRYYWRIPVTGLTSTYNFRVEMYRGTTLDWSWDFGPYPTPSGGTGWFFPEFNLPPSGSWRAVFYVKTGTTWQYLNEFAFTSQ